MENDKNVKYQDYKVIGLVIMIVAAAIAMNQFKVPMIMKDVAASLHMGESSAPWLMSIYTLIGIAFALPAGTLSQKYGPKKIIIMAGLMATAGALLGALSTTAAVMIVSRAIEGIGFIFLCVGAPMTIISYCAPAKIGSAMGIFAVWMPIGQIIAFNATPFMFNTMKLSWHSIWVVFAVVSLITTLAVHFVIKAPEGVDTSYQNQEKVSFLEVIKNKDLICASLAFASSAYLLFCVIIFFPSFAAHSRLMGVSQAGFIASIPMIASIIGCPILGKLSESTGAKPIFVITVIVSTVATALCFIPSIPIILTATIFLGLIGLAGPAMIFISINSIVKNHKFVGIGTGVVITFQNIGFFLATATFPSIIGICGGDYTKAGLAVVPVGIFGIIMAIIAKF
ncbi:MFS transporter [Clostridium estertheticum]|uniref:MFS transporter n=1 Tax=Clostridium estertheticum TaxID=238834 RepID=UPI001CD131A2|nr:MFS transporter [Clostridium estertheticum]MBZ9685246.1 MFS transporter [Clostridium estertheticum]